LASRVKKIEEKIRPKQREYPIVVWQGEEDKAAEKKRQILKKDQNAKFLELRIVWVK
jgi:hypothetical protein